jgi:hypothetical protein
MLSMVSDNKVHKINLPHREVMELLSSWTNFRVTASSIICFTYEIGKIVLAKYNRLKYNKCVIKRTGVMPGKNVGSVNTHWRYNSSIPYE